MIAVDYFRIEDNKIIEHWDVMQEEVAPKDALNVNAFPTISPNLSGSLLPEISPT